MDTVLKSLLQVINPKVETGPGRIISQHPYDDGIMPDYPAEQQVTRDDGDGRGGPTGSRLGYDDNDAPAADYVDGGVVGAEIAPGRRSSVARPGGGEGDPSAAADPGARPLADFIVSLLKTVQLTPRAALKKSRNKLQAAAPLNSTPVAEVRLHGPVDPPAPKSAKPSTTTPTAPKARKLP